MAIGFECGLGLIKVGNEYYYTDCCGNFITGVNNTGTELSVSFNNNLANSGVGNLNTYVTPTCSTPTPTPTPTITPTNTVTPTQTPTNTTTPTPSITPSITPSNTPVTILKNDCDVITLFEMGVSCNVVQSPTDSQPLSGVLSLNVTGGTAPYSFFWEGGQRSQTLFGVPAGTYEAVVIDYYGDYTATTICELAGPVPSLTPTTTPTPTPTTPVQCADLCLIAIGTIGVPNFGPIQFVCDGTQNGRFKWTSGRYDIVWNITNSRWEIYITGTTIPLTLSGGILVSTSFELIPDSAWTVLGGTEQYSITMTQGDCPTVIPLQVSVNKTNSSCQGNTNCNGSLSILVQDGVPPYSYSIDGGNTYSLNSNFTNLCPNTYTVVVYDSGNNSQTTTTTIGYDSVPTTYQLSLSNVGPATTTSIPNVSQTVTQVMNLVVNPPLPVGVSVTFNLLSTALKTINGPGDGTSSVTWNVTKNNSPVSVNVGSTVPVSQGNRPFCSPNTQTVTSVDYSSSITITNGDTVQVTSTTVDTITNGQVASQSNCTTNIITEVSSAISTPTIIGNNCSSVIGGSRQVQTNNFTYVPVPTPVVNKTLFTSGNLNAYTNSLSFPLQYGVSPKITISGSPNDNLTVRFSNPGLNSLPGTTTILGTAFTENISSTFNVQLNSLGVGQITGTTMNTSSNVYGQKILNFEILSSSNNTPIDTQYGVNIVNVKYVVVPPNSGGDVWNGVSSISATTSNQSCGNYSQTNSYLINGTGNVPVVGKTISNSTGVIVNGNNNWITIALAPSLGSSSPYPVARYSVQVNSLGVITNVVPCT